MISIIDPLSMVEQLGSRVVSDIWYAWGTFDQKTNAVTKITPYMTCREALIYFLYNKLIGGREVHYQGKSFSHEELAEISYSSLVLMAHGKNKTGIINNSVTYIKNNFKDVRVIHNDGVTAVMLLPELYYKFPFLTSYFGLIFRITAFFNFYVSLENLHKEVQHLSFAEATYLKKLSYEDIMELLNNVHTINAEKHKKFVRHMITSYGDSVVAAKCGINGIFSSDVAIDYKNFLFNSINESKKQV